ncbi:MAG: hypothetical protein ACJ72Z_01505 [Pyrinomonadaceae bacterium]
MRYAVAILSLLNGLWMLIDGVYVLLNGKYIGPEKPGPWASLLSFTGVDVFNLGPMFIGFGIAWLVFVFGLFAESSWAYWWGIIVALLTLWYLPFGTLISLIVLAALIFFRERVMPA